MLLRSCNGLLAVQRQSKPLTHSGTLQVVTVSSITEAGSSYILSVLDGVQHNSKPKLRDRQRGQQTYDVDNNSNDDDNSNSRNDNNDNSRNDNDDDGDNNNSRNNRVDEERNQCHLQHQQKQQS